MAKPKFAPIRERSMRVMTEWTPSQIRAAESMADGGNLRLAADLCETLLSDDRVQGVLSTRTRGLLGLKLSFEPGVGRQRKQAVKALEDEQDWNVAFPEFRLAKLLDWGILLGVSLARNNWIEGRSGRLLPKLENWHPRWLRYEWERRQWIVTVEGGERAVTRGDGEWILHTPSGDHRPWADGAWRSLSRWWLLKHYARSDIARHGEVHGSPIRVGIAPEGVTADHRKELAADLADIGRDTSMCLPPGYDLKLVEATARTWEMFRAQIDMANIAISIRLAGQNLTSEVRTGSLAAAQVHKEIRADLIRSDGENASTDLHDQALEWWAEYNFGNRDLAPWPVWATAPPADEAEKAATRKAQCEAVKAARDAGVDPTPLLEEFGLALANVEASPSSDSQPSGPEDDN